MNFQLFGTNFFLSLEYSHNLPSSSTAIEQVRKSRYKRKDQNKGWKVKQKQFPLNTAVRKQVKTFWNFHFSLPIYIMVLNKQLAISLWSLLREIYRASLCYAWCFSKMHPWRKYLCAVTLHFINPASQRPVFVPSYIWYKYTAYEQHKHRTVAKIKFCFINLRLYLRFFKET